MKKMLIVLMALLPMSAFATNEHGPCAHPVFVTHACLASQDNDGEDGEDGERGPRGYTGPQGEQGIQGERGLPGTVPTDWINTTNFRFGRFAEYVAASTVLDIDLAREGDHRMTFTGASVWGTTAVGFGYSYTDEDNVSLKIGYARSGDADLVKIGFGFEW